MNDNAVDISPAFCEGMRRIQRETRYRADRFHTLVLEMNIRGYFRQVLKTKDYTIPYF